MKGKRQHIKQRVRAMVLLIAVFSLIINSAVSIIGMLRIKDDSSKTLIEQMRLNINNILISKADFADSNFGKYADYISNFADYINELYKNTNSYIRRQVLPPDILNKNKLTMQRTFSSRNIKLEDVENELSLLGNLEQIWKPIVMRNSDVITSVYIGTESGFMISYDNYSELDEGETESYYNYFDSIWYKGAKEKNTVFFTEVYRDSYGRGLMISCAAPFYDENDEFAGVVCMDMLISDLYRSVISLNLGEKTEAFLIDNFGNIITDKEENSQNTTFNNIYENVNIEESLAKNIMEGKKGVLLSDNGSYYAYTLLTRVPWKLCFSIPQDTVLKPVHNMNVEIIKTIILFVVFFIVIIILVLFVSKKLSRQFTEPLISLGKDVAVISKGNLDYSAKIYNNDEIGDLAAEFNNMASSLKKYIDDFTAITVEKERIGAELNVATQIQIGMIPNVFPAFPDIKEIDVYATMTPAKEVGGDFYDFFFVDETHFAMVIADVSGKGVPAALFMMISKILLNDRAMIGGTPSDILAFVNDRLYASNLADMFVTVWFGILDINTGVVMAANAGHEYPAITNTDGIFELHKDKHGFVLGGMEGIKYKDYTFTLNKGDYLYLYTDGVPEATYDESIFFGKENMLNSLNKKKGRTPENILKDVKSDIDNFVKNAPQFDDITMLCVKYNGKEG